MCCCSWGLVIELVHKFVSLVLHPVETGGPYLDSMFNLTPNHLGVSLYNEPEYEPPVSPEIFKAKISQITS